MVEIVIYLERLIYVERTRDWDWDQTMDGELE